VVIAHGDDADADYMKGIPTEMTKHFNRKLHPFGSEPSKQLGQSSREARKYLSVAMYERTKSPETFLPPLPVICCFPYGSG
jgi:hypothetical protein